MSERFYINCPLQPGVAVELEGAEAHHLAVVCRLCPGAEIALFNGDGHEYPSLVTAVQRRRVRIQVEGTEAPPRELGFVLEVAAPLPKGNRGQFLMEKLTELGITRFVPLLSRRSLIRPKDNTLEKLRRYVIEASKQCGRNVLVQVEPAQPWPSYCRCTDAAKIKILAQPGGQSFSSAGRSTTGAEDHRAVVVAVGPEGGLTAEEVAQAEAAGWQLLDLGPRRLRVETAAVVLAAWAAAGLFHGGLGP